SSLISLYRGSFDVIVGIDWLSKRKFVIVCHKKVVEIPLEGSRKLRVQGERTLGVAKALMNAKVDEPKVGDISIVRDYVDVFPEDLSGLPPQRHVEFHIDLVYRATYKTRVSYDLVIFREEHQCRLLRRGAWSSFEVSVRITEEGEVVTYLRFIANFSKIVKPHTSLTEKNQKMKPRRVQAVAMTIQYGVRGMILAVQSEAFKQDNVPWVGSERDEAHASSLRYLSENEIESSWILSLNFQGQSSEYDVIWVMVDRLTKLAHLLAIQEDFKMSSVLWVEIGESSLIGLELVQEMTDKILERIGLVVDRLRLPEEMSCVHDTLHVLNQKKNNVRRILVCMCHWMRSMLTKLFVLLTPKEVNRMKYVPYASAVGSIMYAVRCTRPDVALAQNLTSWFQQNPGELHWTAVKNILKYLRNTKDVFLVYGGNPSTELRVEYYCDAGFETDKDDTKS
ncbi:hypothetical protein Tco_0785067, partial [Tanacetum coccineum]